MGSDRYWPTPASSRLTAIITAVDLNQPVVYRDHEQRTCRTVSSYTAKGRRP